MPEPDRRRPFDDIRRALEIGPGGAAATDDGKELRSDPARLLRTGAPEIVYGAGKTPEQVVAALTQLAGTSGRAIASRCDPATLKAITALNGTKWRVEIEPLARIAVIARPNSSVPPALGLVGIVAAGTSDLPVAREIEVVAREVGCGTRLVVDVGVAGLHRLVAPLEQLIEDGVDLLLVVAGMDGALPSVIAGLVPVPVIGVPTSTGYGFGGDGTAAMMAMIQSCAPGLTVVNIDNGIGAAIAAGRIVHAIHGSSSRHHETGNRTPDTVADSTE